jgi:hypothetical protein
MNDKELLELAAKAAGVKLDKWYESANAYLVVDVGAGTRIWWNPLTDDGDALRLAVKLGIKSKFNSALNQAIAWYGYQRQDIHINLEDYNNDPYAATRRAIVRAAAEIGEMK